MASILNPQASPWFPIKSMLPHAVYPSYLPPPPPPYLQPPISLLQQPIQLYNINSPTLHVPFSDHNSNVYYPYQPLNCHWNGDFDQEAPNVQNFGFEQKDPKAQSFGSDQKDPKVQSFSSDLKDPKDQNFGFEVTLTAQYRQRTNFFSSNCPRFKKIMDPPAVTKVWKIRRTEVFRNDDESKDGKVKEAVEQDSGSSVIADKKKTSVMIRNIPNQFRRDEILGFLDFYCINHNSEYDFFYLPMDFMRHNNLGYAFVNFTTSSSASKFMSLLDGYKWSTASQGHLQIKSSKKVCQMNWARIQGKEELVKHFQQSKFCCEENEYLPVVFSPPRNGSTCLSTPSTIGKLGGISTPKRR